LCWTALELLMRVFVIDCSGSAADARALALSEAFEAVMKLVSDPGKVRLNAYKESETLHLMSVLHRCALALSDAEMDLVFT